jgi:hypothetical protein
MPIELTLRAFALAAQDTEAIEVMSAILRHLSTDEILSSQVDRYWKIREWYELLVRLRARGATAGSAATVERISAALGTAWTFRQVGEDADAVWRREDGGRFVDPRVTWANLQCFPVET